MQDVPFLTIQLLTAAPVLVKVLGSLALILILNSLTRRLVIALPAGTLVLALWSGHSWPAIAAISWKRFSSTDNLCLLVIVFQVIWLSSQMAKAGVMRDLVNAVRARISHRKSIAVLPAIIGMLPMPGGAIFSAPLVADCDHENVLQPLLKTQINYWFRHVWEYWWPLYPGVLLAIQITGLDVWQFVAVQLPLSVLAIATGSWFLLRKIEEPDEPANDDQDKPHLAILLAPIAAVVVVYTIIRIAIPGLADANRYLPMIAALFAAMLVLQKQRPLSRHAWGDILRARKTFELAALVAIVLIYGAFIDARLPGGNLLVEQVRSELQAWGFPVTAIIMILPFLSGLASGLAIGFVGASFPIVFSLLGDDPGLAKILTTTVLAYGFGYMGMILSPVHICLIVTNKHFDTRPMDSILRLLPLAIVVLLGVCAYWFALKLLLS